MAKPKNQGRPSNMSAEAAARGRKVRKLKSVENLRVFVAHWLRVLEGPKGNTSTEPVLSPERLAEVKVMIYAASTLAGLIEGSKVEARIAKLEEQLAARGLVPGAKGADGKAATVQ